MKSILCPTTPSQEKYLRLRAVIFGCVQGVGFRPFIYRLANELGLSGWIVNSSSGVTIEVEGAKEQLEIFVKRIREEKPVCASIQSFEYSFLNSVGYKNFEIRFSDSSGDKTALILPDIAMCPDCLKEIFDSNNRRYLYPFTNCTNCGPRFSIIESLPYDRANTSMKDFAMCPQCQNEYNDPANRRFHAEVNACPVCGPHLALWNDNGKEISKHQTAILEAVEAIKDGAIVALKGLGGFQLIADARNNESVKRLRQRKHREEKPFALMFPSLQAIEAECNVSALEKQLLLSSEAPIVLLKRKISPNGSTIASSIAPANPYLGVMLPYTPLHHILMRQLEFPVVATSGNLSDEPICIDEHEALARLKGIADVFLAHNRGIVRHMDDSIVRVVADRPLLLRRARGYAPLPVRLMESSPSILAVGGHLKNTVALSVGQNVFLSQHIGDLETAQSTQAFNRSTKDLPRLYDATIKLVACDMHPEYLSTKFAKESGITMTQVQHHHAHIVSCMSENDINTKVLGVSWDGTGLGSDETIWGGEFLLSTLSSFKRMGHLRTFRLPGGDKAVKEQRRSAMGVLYEIFGETVFERNDFLSVKAFTANELVVIKQMLKSSLNSPVTSSAGRLFDAVSSLIGLYQQTTFEGQAAMGLEFILPATALNENYPFAILEKSSAIIDWEPMMREILEDLKQNVSRSVISAKFHNTLVEMIVQMAQQQKEKQVCLSGGCFQNKYLLERAVERLREEGFSPIWHQRVPTNDGGIALGQIVVAAAQLKKY